MRAHEQYGVQPFAFHATYSADKLMKLREEVRMPQATRTMHALPEPAQVASLLRTGRVPRFAAALDGWTSFWSRCAKPSSRADV